MLPKELLQLLQKHNGVLTSAQAHTIGLSNERLRLLVKTGELERAGFGVYISPNEFPDTLYLLQLRRPKLIYSHETALYLHDLTDRDPVQYFVTVPTGYNTKTLLSEGLNVFSIKKGLYDLGKIQMTTVFGNSVMTYNMERTLCDCLRSRNRMDPAIVTDALKRYSERKDKDLHALMKMAEQFHVIQLMRNYMEVLL